MHDVTEVHTEVAKVVESHPEFELRQPMLLSHQTTQSFSLRLKLLDPEQVATEHREGIFHGRD